MLASNKKGVLVAAKALLASVTITDEKSAGSLVQFKAAILILSERGTKLEDKCIFA